jgi:DNA-binding transcriptional ArsR family regulator
MTSPQLEWDWGTAYDLFISLAVLHKPSEFSVRRAWAAGVRARLTPPVREVLEQSLQLIHVPLGWIHSLKRPKDASGVLWALGQVPPAERLPLLTRHPDQPPELKHLFQQVADRGAWDDGDLEALRTACSCAESMKAPDTEDLTTILDWWSRVEEFGERYLHALHAYQEAFFEEEEKRIRPALRNALADARALAKRLALPDLLEELSQGLRYSAMPDVAAWVLAPSYWVTPLVMFDQASSDQVIWVFGARPHDASLVPGEAVPDAMLRALKALSDPTRLRILHYLAQEPLTPAELARRLRLRPPTVTHHLKALRLAGLVQLTLDEGQGDKRYSARVETVKLTFGSLNSFLEQGT